MPEVASAFCDATDKIKQQQQLNLSLAPIKSLEGSGLTHSPFLPLGNVLIVDSCCPLFGSWKSGWTAVGQS